MATPYLAEIRIFSCNFAPKGWALCNGQILPINQNQALFALLGTTYGGNGQTTFALPDLRGRVPIHWGGNGILLGQRSGEESHALTVNELPAHIHQAAGTKDAANTSNPSSQVWAVLPASGYEAASNTSMASNALSVTGGSQPHQNMQPYTTLNFCIALAGIFPTQY